MKVAVAQISCALGEVDRNIHRLREDCARAREAGAELIVFPEMADTGYSMAVIRQHATTWKEGAVPQLQQICRDFSLAIISGVSERAGGSIFNAQVFIDGAGVIAAHYRKTHLFGAAPIAEHTCFSAGTELTSSRFGGLHLGFSICYDLRFPEVYRALACDHGANVFVVSSAWPFPRVEHLRILATARAIENQCYLLLANRVGTDAGVTFCGTSSIIDPSGIIVAAASPDREQIIYADLSSELLETVRSGMPVFADRRRDLYRPSI